MTLAYVLFGATLFLLCLAVINALAWPRIRRTAKPASVRVSVLIPARNEEANLPDCLASVLRQGEIVSEILVYDDHSTDGTADVIRRLAAKDARIRAVPATPLLSGWCGKNFACAQLANAATGEWFLFLDADARLVDEVVARMLTEMITRKLTFLSCWPRLEMLSFWERALMPLLNFVVFSIFPAPLSLWFNRPSLALAHGACLLFERSAYERLGGHSAVRDQIFEDTRLAQLWRASGERGLCLDGQDVVRVRMYGSFGEIWQGFQKNFYPAFQYGVNFWLFLLFHLVVFWLPFALWIVAPNAFAVGAIACVILIRLVLAQRFGHPLWAAFLHPLGEAILLALGLSSWWRCKSGQGVAWKGREYHVLK